MAQLVANTDSFTLELSRWEHLGSLSRNIVVPMTSLVRARRIDELQPEIRGIRMPGTSIPKRIYLGTWRAKNMDKEFLAIYRDEPGYLIDLVDHDYVRLLVSSPPVDFLE